MRYVLLLFLVACSSTPHMLADGAPLAPVEPRVTYTPAGAGLPPEYWGRPEAPKVERSPHKRVLPQTPATMKEPGIWASDAPLGRVATLLGIPMPLPPEAHVDVDAYARACAATLDNTARDIGVVVPPEVTIEARTCLAMRLYYYCLVNAAKGKDVDEPTTRRLSEFIASVSAHAASACRGIDRMFHDRPFNAIAAAWRARYVTDSGTPSL